ncbi:type VII secretion-associated serine protease mycosin [Mangrovihabitans endophyticus]|nr:type VII secretion-associated serine protease mycosin [Mangrovihabitans endophyticus]
MTSPATADATRDEQWHLKYLNIKVAHSVTKGSGITVGVVDTGVSPHPDLDQNLLDGKDVISDSTGNGKVDEIGHGTAMAGIIAAHGHGKSSGVIGIAPETRILPVKEEKPGFANAGLNIAPGIEYAASKDVDIINVSLSSAPSLALQRAVMDAQKRDILIVAAAGNRPNDFAIGYPAAMPGVLAVGATDREGKHLPFSVEDNKVGLCAPGIDIETTYLNRGYATSRGTSDATAIVSGAAALVRAKFPDLSAQEVIHRLTATATDVGPPGRDEECGYGIVNIVKALTADVPPLDGAGASEPSSSPPAESSPPAPPQSAPEGEAQTSSVNVPAVVGGIVGVLLLGGLIFSLVVQRRRRRTDR